MSSEADSERRALARRASQRNHETAGTFAETDKKKKPVVIKAWVHGLSGAVAGCCEVLGTSTFEGEVRWERNTEFSGVGVGLSENARRGFFSLILRMTSDWVGKYVGKFIGVGL